MTQMTRPSTDYREIIEAADQMALDLLASKLRYPLIEWLMLKVSKWGEDATIWIFLGSAFALTDGNQRRAWIRVALLGPVAIIINYAFKLLFRRPRPEKNNSGELNGSPSFPSAHATSSFAVAVAMGRINGKVRLPTLTLAGLVGFSRPYLRLHYPSDVAAGALLGIGIGILATPERKG